MFRVHVTFNGNNKHLDGVYQHVFTESTFLTLENEKLGDGSVKQVEIYIPYTSILFWEMSES